MNADGGLPMADDRAPGVAVFSVTVGPFDENSYLVMDKESRAAVLVDPGENDPRILEMVTRANADLKAIWLTHAHIDHVGGIAAVKRSFDVPVHMHPLDLPIYTRGADVAAMYNLPFDPPPPHDRDLADGDVLELGGLRFDVLHVPGHAPGHVAFLGHGCMLSGDVLFAGSIGRTDLPFCDSAAMQRSLERLATLPEETQIYAGHGRTTTIGDELRSNPFLNGIARVAK